MKNLLIKAYKFLFYLLALLLLSPMNGVAQKLEDYKWQNRIVLLVDETLESISLKEQMQLFLAEKKEMTERDLVLLITDGTRVLHYNGEQMAITFDEIRTKAWISSDFKGVLLIGKDGGCKLKKNFPVKPIAIFDEVDRMPMRQVEMGNKLKAKL